MKALMISAMCTFMPSAAGQVVEFESDAANWMAAVGNQQAFAFDSFFPGVPGLSCLSGSVGAVNLDSTVLTITLGPAGCAIYDGSSVYGCVSDAYLPSNVASSRWEFSVPVVAFYTYYGSFAPGRTVVMTLYSGDTQVGVLSRESGGNEVLAYGHGFVSDVPVDRIDFTLAGPGDQVLIGAFVGLAPGEPSLGTVSIPGYAGPGGSVVNLDVAVATRPRQRAASPVPWGAVLVIGGFNATRAGPWSYLDEGSQLTILKTAIDTAFPHASYYLTGVLTDEYLAGIDVLLITSARAGTSAVSPLTTDEQAALRRFVEAGGGALIFVDNNSFAGSGTDQVNESLVDAFGLDVCCAAGWPEQVNVLAPESHAVTNGPFGLIAEFTQFYGGWFDGLGEDATALGTLAVQGETALAVIDSAALAPTSGAVVFFADTSMIWNDFITEANKNLVLNSIAYAAPPATIQADYGTE